PRIVATVTPYLFPTRRSSDLNGGFDVDVLPANHPGQHAGHENIKNRANNQRCQDANGKITLRFLAFLGRRGDSVETDVREKDVRDRKSTRLNSSHVAISYAVF